MNTKQLALAAHNLLSQPGVWIKGELARSGDGAKVPYRSPEARHFCLSGALSRVCFNFEDYYKLSGEVQRAIYRAKGSFLVDFNDDPKTTLADVLVVLKKVAEEA